LLVWWDAWGPIPLKWALPVFFAEGGGMGKNRGVAGTEWEGSMSMGGGIFLPTVGIP